MTVRRFNTALGPSIVTAIEQAGTTIPVPPHVTLWQTKTSAKLHTISDCPILTRSPITVMSQERSVNDTAMQRQDAWCQTCSDKKHHNAWWANYRAIITLSTAETWIAGHTATVVTTSDKMRLEKLLVDMRAILDVNANTPLELREHTHKLLGQITALVGSNYDQTAATEAATLLAAIDRACGASQEGNPDGNRYEYRHFSTRGKTDRRGNPTRRAPAVFVMAWETLKRVAETDGLDTAFVHARIRAIEELATTAVHNEPKDATLNGSDFAHPRDWLRAEWEIAAVVEIDEILAGWKAQIESKIDSSLCLIYADPPGRDVAHRALFRSTVLAPWPTVQVPRLGQFHVVSETVASCLVGRSDFHHLGQPRDIALLECAAQLTDGWVRHNPSIQTIIECLEAAEMVCV